MVRLPYRNLILFLLLGGCSSSTSNIQIDQPIPEQDSFIAGLPLIVQNQIHWFSDYEDDSFQKWEDEGTFHEFSGGGIFITDVQNVAYGIENTTVHSGKKSSFARINNADSPGENKAVRFMRWTDKAWDDTGDYFPDETYYSVFLFLPETYNPAKPTNRDPLGDGGWWNIFQFKSENNAGSHPISSLDLYNENGKMYFGLITNDYTDDNSEIATIMDYHEQENPIEVESKKWIHLEAFYKKSKNYDGEIRVWQNGVEIFHQKQLRTVLPQGETAVWGLNNYTDYVEGEGSVGEATIYFDDAIIAPERISNYLNK